MELQEVKKIIQEILQTQKYGVYTTIRNEQPHSALVVFAATPDLSKIIILTNKNTRKYINTQIHHKVTLFISTTKNESKDLDEALTLSAIGTAEVSDKLSPELIQEYREYYLEKNSYMKSLAETITDIIVITVDSYEVTKSFQRAVVQTGTDMTTIKVRQLPGVAVVKGVARGKLVTIKTFSELCKEHENNIIAINIITKSEKLPAIKIKGLIVGQTNIPKELVDFLQTNKIPTIQGIGTSLELLTNSKDVTVNGSLGVIIFHEIKA